MKRILFLLLASHVGLLGQSTRQPIELTRIYGITTAWPGECGPGTIDNRSSLVRRNNSHSFYASGSGTWMVTLQYSDTSCSGPWTSYGSTGVVTQSTVVPVGGGIDVTPAGYHQFLSFAITGANASTVSINYNGTRDYYGGSAAGGGGGGGGITSLNGLTAGSQVFAPVSDSNVTLGIGSATSTHTFTIGWSGTLPKGRQTPTTVYSDQGNTYTAGAQDFSLAGSLIVPRGNNPAVTTSGQLGYDTTGNFLRAGVNGVMKTVAFLDSSITGNALTASFFDHPPIQCPSGQVATGISTTGAANCTATGSVSGPVSSSVGFIPQWGDTLGKTLTAGLAASVSSVAGGVPLGDGGGKLDPGWLPNPSSSTLGGVQSAAAVSSQWIDSISTLGVPHLSRPSASDLSNGITGSGLVVLQGGATLIAPSIGNATAISVNKIAITPPATGSTLTIDDGKTFRATNSLVLSGTDSTTITFQGTDTYIGRATTDTLVNKTFDTGGAGNVFRIAGTQITAIAGNTGTLPTKIGSWTTGHCLQVDATGGIGDSGSATCGVAGGAVWSALSNPSGNLSLAMGSNTSTFTSGATTGSANLWNFTDTASNTGTGILVDIFTAASSAAIPFQVTAAGTANGIRVNSSGVMAAVGTGGLDASSLSTGTVPSARLVAIPNGSLANSSITVAVPAELTVSGSPVSLGATVTIGKATQSPNVVWAGPTSGGAAVPAFRALVAADIPDVSATYWKLSVPNTITNVAAPSNPASGHLSVWADSTNNILSVSNSAGAVSSTVIPTDCSTGGQVLGKINANGTVTCITPAGGGNVTSAATIVNGNVPVWTGTYQLSAGIGVASTSTAAVLIQADGGGHINNNFLSAVPNSSLAFNTIGITVPAEFTVLGSNPIPLGNNIILAKTVQSANTFWAGPTSGGSASPAFRPLIPFDIPVINLASSTNGGVTGNLQIANFNGGSGASSANFWRGDGAWQQVDYSQITNTPAISYQTVLGNGTPVTQRPKLNFVAGSNISLTAVDVGFLSETVITIAATSTSGTWNGLGNPTGNLSLSMGSNSSTFSYGAATGSGSMWSLQDTANNTGTGALMTVATAAGSSASPVSFTARDSTIGVAMDPTGFVKAMSVGGVDRLAVGDNPKLFDFPPQANGTVLTSGTPVAITMSPCPRGVNASDVNHYYYISGGTGSPEVVHGGGTLGGTCTSGAASGTIGILPANNHSGFWNIRSASAGIYEALSYGVSEVDVPAGTFSIYTDIYIENSSTIRCAGRDASILQAMSATQNIFRVVTTGSVTISGCDLTSSVTKTLGAAIAVFGSGGNPNVNTHIVNNFINSQYNGIDFEQAIYFVVDGLLEEAISNDGIIVNNTLNADQGDSAISNTVLACCGVAGIEWNSGGGLRISNTKIIGGWTYGLDLNWTGSVGSGGLEITGSDIAGWKSSGAGVRLSINPSSGSTASYGDIQIVGNTISTSSSGGSSLNSPAITIFGQSSLKGITGVTISANKFDSPVVVGQYAQFINISDNNWVVNDSSMTSALMDTSGNATGGGVLFANNKVFLGAATSGKSYSTIASTTIVDHAGDATGTLTANLPAAAAPGSYLWLVDADPANATCTGGHGGALAKRSSAGAWVCNVL